MVNLTPEQLRHLTEKVANIKLVLTDNDGVLTDTGVYYAESGEVMKRFSIRDGMGVERLRDVLGIETGIITGEVSPSLKKRAEKLKITHLFLGIKDKKNTILSFLEEKHLTPSQVAYIGDDYNDIEMIELAGLTACPGDAMPHIQTLVDYICTARGGNGAFREFAELIIMLQTKK